MDPDQTAPSFRSNLIRVYSECQSNLYCYLEKFYIVLCTVRNKVFNCFLFGKIIERMPRFNFMALKLCKMKNGISQNSNEIYDYD